MSPLGKIPEELFQHQLAPYMTKGGDLFPQIHLVDGKYDDSHALSIAFNAPGDSTGDCEAGHEPTKAERKSFLVVMCCHMHTMEL